MKPDTTELVLDVVAEEVARAVKEERNRCVQIARLFGTASAVEIAHKIRTGWQPRDV